MVFNFDFFLKSRENRKLESPRTFEAFHGLKKIFVRLFALEMTEIVV